MKDGQRATRERKKTTGHGKNKKQGTDTWDVVALEGLTSAGFYSELGSGSHENRNDFKQNPINAVVVLHDPYREKNPNVKTLVILTNGPVSKPLNVYDGYDARSEIENSLFRESKQGWFIKRPPENSTAGFLVHAYLTILTMALTRAFRDWMIQQEKSEDAGEDTGIRKFRQKYRPPSAILILSRLFPSFILCKNRSLQYLMHHRAYRDAIYCLSPISCRISRSKLNAD